MTISTDYDGDLAQTIPHLTAIHDAIKGQFFVKSKGSLYLPSPHEINPNSNESQAKYDRFLAGAEFDEYTGQTQQSMIGRMGFNDIDFEPDPKIDYLAYDCDGDGTSINGSIEKSANMALSDKWCIGVVDYKGLAGIEADSLSAADIEEINAKAQIKLYSRKSVVRRNFSVVNGKNQLDFIMFCESSYTMNSNFDKVEVKSYLILALDEDGNYFQQKIIETENGGKVEGERDYVMINGEPLKFIPAVILSDSELENELPLSFGFLSPIAQICFARYNVSGDYKYYLGRLAPTINITGMTEHEQQVFKTVNGRDYYEIGGVNQFANPESVVDIQAIDGSTEAYEKYFSDSKERLVSIGADVNDNNSANTATEAGINFTKQNSVLNPLADSLENGYKWLVSYCAMFEGLTTQDDLFNYAETVELTLSRDFDTPILNPQHVSAINEAVMSGLMTRLNAVNKLIELGWQKGDAEKILDEAGEVQPIV